MLMEVVISIEFIATAIAMIVALAAWFLRLEGRINMNARNVKEVEVRGLENRDKIEKTNENVQKQALELERGNERFAHIDQTLTEIKQAVQQIANNTK